MLHQQQTPSVRRVGSSSSNMALRRYVKPGMSGMYNMLRPLPQQLLQQQQRLPRSSGAATRSLAAGTAAAAETTTGDTTNSSSSSSSVTRSRRVGVSEQTQSGRVQGSGGKSLMIVESPTKATKIQKFLGDEYKVLASYGHVRDLASKSGSVKPEEGFSLVWQMTKSGEAKLTEMAAASAGCRALLLATDPDREGEAISWHITEELKRRGVLPRPGLTLQRVTFNEVTQKAIHQALQQPRQVSQDLVDAYLARRALDYLVGYNLSPLLWRKLGRAARSAGRVQSVALRLVCDRESERQLFTPQEHWSISADFSTETGSSSSSSSSGSSSSSTLPARLVQVDSVKLQAMSLTSQQQAEMLVQRLWQQQQQQQDVSAAAAVLYKVTSVIRKPVKRNPPPPLVTSTLQQEASRKLGWSGSKTMQVAQQLYEGATTGEGLITYMRTDGVNISAEAVETLRDVIGSKYGPEYLPPAGSRVYKSRAKNAQEAHEAIRPTNPSLQPGHVQGLTPDQAKLYAIVWSRAVASQMESAEVEQLTAELASPCGNLLLRSSGSSMTFPGYLAAWRDHDVTNSVTDDVSDSQAEAAAAETTLDVDDLDGFRSTTPDEGDRLSPMLQQLQEGQQVALVAVLPAQHFTKPPPRFTEATMVKTLEGAGVGRPSTYATIIRLLQDRGYVVKSGRSLVPTPLGRLMTAYLTLFFSKYVDVNFTAQVEDQLDEVSAGSLAWRRLLAEFHTPLQQDIAAANTCSTRQVYEQLEQQLEQLIFQPVQTSAAAATQQPETSAAAAAAAAADPRVCPVCGGRLVLKPNQYTGGFIGCSNHDTQGCTFSRPLWPDQDEQLLLSDEESDIAAGEISVMGSSKLLGVDPDSGRNVWIKRGPFGLYLQLGDDPAAAAVSTSDGSSSSSSSSSSRKSTPTSQLPGNEAAPTRAALPKGISWSSIRLEQALQQLSLPRTVGLHPDSGEPVLANLGRFGPYLSHKTLSCTLPKGLGPLDITLEQALEALGKKEQRLRAKGQDPYEVKESKKKKRGKTSQGKSSSSTTSSSSTSSRKPKAMTGYNVFIREMKDSIAAAATGVQGTSKLALIAQAWKALSADEQEQYKQRAKEMSEAAAAAAAAAEASNSSSSGSSSSSSTSSSSNGRRAPATTAKRRHSKSSSSSTSSRGSSSSSRRRPSSLRAVSGYLHYCQQQRSQIVAAHPTATFGDIAALLGAAWRDLDEQQKQHWTEQAAAAAAAAAEEAPALTEAAPTAL